MSYTNIDNSILTYKISDGAFKLYYLLQSMCFDQKTECFPSQRFLSGKLNKSVRTIQRYLEELIDNKLIEKRRRGSISNVYTCMLKVISNKINKTVEVAKSAYNSYKNNNQYSSNKYPKKESTFNSFEQRNYDFNKLETLLLGGDGELSDCLLE